MGRTSVPRRRVVVTGVGPVTSIGMGRETFWQAVLKGVTGARRINFPWLGDKFKCRVGAPVEPVDLEPFGITEKDNRLIDPTGQLALAASFLALQDAELSSVLADEQKGQFRVEGVDPERIGVVLGTGIGGLCTIEKTHRTYLSGAPLTGTNRFAVPMLIPNAIPAQVAIRWGFRGECKAIATACAAGTMAIGDAFRLIRDGELDMALAGGVDKTLSDVDGYSLIGFDLLNTLSRRNEEPERASRPFDRDRDGFVMSEGAAVLVLESEEQAKARGARIYCEVAGYAATCDAHSMLQLEPSGEQICRVMSRALRDADLACQDICYVNAHGTSTRLNDPTESRALHTVFGHHLRDTLVNSTKALTGHAIGASGAIEAITTALTLAKGMIHRCVNLDIPDPECDLPFPRENTTFRPLAALSNSFGFGGHNASLVLRPL